MLERADVVDLVREHRAALEQSAVFAAIECPLSDLPAELIVHGDYVPLCKLARALACRRSTNWPTNR